MFYQAQYLPPIAWLSLARYSGISNHFGNLVSNIEASYVQGKTWYVKAAGLMIPGWETYADVEVGDAIALIGSHGWVEIAINSGNAQLQLLLQLGDEVEVLV